MGWLPEPVERLLEVALVGELTVVGRNGRPITHPLIPLYDGTHSTSTPRPCSARSSSTSRPTAASPSRSPIRWPRRATRTAPRSREPRA